VGQRTAGDSDWFGEARASAYLGETVKVYAGLERNDIAIAKAGGEFQFASVEHAGLGSPTLWIEGQAGEQGHAAVLAGLTMRIHGSGTLLKGDREDYAPQWWSARARQPSVATTAPQNYAGAAAYGGAYSDARLKRDVIRIGTLASGIALYRFRYLWSHIEHIGVMAQEVLETMPDTVRFDAAGYMSIDYAKLGLRMYRGSERGIVESLLDCLGPPPAAPIAA
jgi:hypothetical protein